MHKGCALAQGLFAPRCMCKGHICTIVCVCVCVCAQARGVSTGSLRLCAAELRSRKRFGHAPGACTPGTGPCTGGTRLHAPAVPGAAGTPPYSAPGSESAPSPAGTAAPGHGSGDQQRTRGRGTLEDTAGAGHLGPGFSIFPNFPKSPPRKPYKGLFYPTGAHVGLCFPQLSPSPCPNPAPGGSALLISHHRGIFGAGDGSPVPPPGYRSPASWQPVPGIADLAQPSLFFHQSLRLRTISLNAQLTPAARGDGCLRRLGGLGASGWLQKDTAATRGHHVPSPQAMG